MIVLSRKVGQEFMIGDGIRVKVVNISGKNIRLEIVAPAGTEIVQEPIGTDIVAQGPGTAAQA